MVAQLAELHAPAPLALAEMPAPEPVPAPTIVEGLADVRAAAENLRAALRAAEGRGERILPELAMLTEVAERAARAAKLFDAKHYPRAHGELPFE